MSECRQCLWMQKTDRSTGAPKLCSLPPTTEAFVKNIKRAHFQVAQWYAALDSDPLPLDPRDYGWEADGINNPCQLCLCQQVLFWHQTTSSGSFDVAVSQTPPANQRNVDVQTSKFRVPDSVLAQAGHFASTSSIASLLMMTTTMVILCRRWTKKLSSLLFCFCTM